MKKFLNTLGNILLTLLVMLLIVYGWAFFEIKIMLKSNPEIFGYVFWQENSDDMETDFSIDDIIVVKKNDNYNIGDRIMYLREDGEYIVHYVVAKDTVSTTTKCNTCFENDEPIDNSTVVGRVVGKIKFLGKFINFFKQKWVLTVMAVAGFACVIISQYIHYKPKKTVEKV